MINFGFLIIHFKPFFLICKYCYAIFFYIFFVSTWVDYEKMENNVSSGTQTKVTTASKLKNTHQKQRFCHISADVSSATEPKPEKFGS